MHVIAAKAVCLHEALQPEFAGYQKQILANAATLAKALADAGFRIVSGGTDTHLMLVDVFLAPGHRQGGTGSARKRRDHRQQERHPLRHQSPRRRQRHPRRPPAVTSRGMREPEMLQIAGWISKVLNHLGDEAVIRRVRREVEALTDQFPLYENRRAAVVGSRG